MKKLILPLLSVLISLAAYAGIKESTVYYDASSSEIPIVTIGYDITLPPNLTAGQRENLLSIIMEYMSVWSENGKCVSETFDYADLRPITPQIEKKAERLMCLNKRSVTDYWWHRTEVSPMENAADGVAVMQIADDIYTGGIHPMYTFVYINYSLKDSRELKLTEYVDTTDNALMDALAKDLKVRFKKKYEADPWVEMYVSPEWYPTESGLTFVYQPYDLGPWYMGAPDLTISYPELEALKIKAPEKEEFSGPIYEAVEQSPEFIGGQFALNQWLCSVLRYPEEAQEANIQGNVVVSFVVEPDGSISHQSIARSVDPILDKEALRVVRRMPNWRPGKINGKAVRTQCMIPIGFKMSN